MSTQNTSDTPLTDAKEFTAYWPISFNRNESGMVVDASEVRRLERENARLREALDVYAMAESAVNQLALFGRFIEGGSPTPLFDALRKHRAATDAARAKAP